MTKARTRHFDEFGAHTRLKHFVLASYLKGWARILLEADHDRVWFIDAFAGAGKDARGNPGSPRIACDIANEVREYFQSRGMPSKSVRVIAIEADAKRFGELQKNLGEFSSPEECVTTLRGSLEDHFDRIQTLVGSDPMLVFLDPYGLKGLEGWLVEEVLKGSHRETLMLFNDEAALRLRGAARAKPIESRLALDLFEDASSRKSDSHAVAQTAAASEEILQRAFGGLWHLVEDTLQHNSSADHGETLVMCYGFCLNRWGAEYVFSFSVTDEESRHKYYLVHAAKDPRAKIAMKTAIHTAMRARRTSPSEQSELLFESVKDYRHVCEEIALKFAGQTVRWQGRNDQKTIRYYAEAETDLLFEDFPALKGDLRRLGFEVCKRPLTYTFPPLSSMR